jgi:hypothetical protein
LKGVSREFAAMCVLTCSLSKTVLPVIAV